MEKDTKNRISHRGRALAKVKDYFSQNPALFQ